MSSSKTFVIGVKPRDVLVDLKGMSEKATNAYLRFWMLHALHGEPLPPREEKIDRDEWNAWFRDKLDMKNVRTWIRARDELLALSKLRIADDGRLYIGRTMRDAEKRRGGDPARWSSEGDGQGDLDLQGVHCAQLAVEKPVEAPGELRQSGEVRAKFERTSTELPRNLPPKCLFSFESRPSLSWSKSKSIHELLLSGVGIRARARGDPAIAA